ncbi:MAG: hypothetical protein GC191_09340 [Azospirillum sp.]|nr:hypothetical protein [Azospirillum sp.]
MDEAPAYEGLTDAEVGVAVALSQQIADLIKGRSLSVIMTALGIAGGTVIAEFEPAGLKSESRRLVDELFDAYHVWREAAVAAPDLGPCCICSGTAPSNILMLARRAAVPGHGWGCVQCGLPSDGAVAVLCDGCLTLYQADAAILTACCRGWPATDGRIAIADLPQGVFEHNLAMHPESGLEEMRP